eukprot:173779_1
MRVIFLHYFLSICIGTIIKWKHWIDLPVANSKILATTYQHSIVVIGGTKTNNAVYKINGSAATKTGWWHTITVSQPDSIEIKNDNFVTYGRYTYIFGPSLSNKNMIFSYNHEIDQFTESQIPSPSNSVAYPCVVQANEYIFLIGGVTYQNGNSITCTSTTSAYSLDSSQWQTYSDRMPWDVANHSGACYNLCQQYNKSIYLFGGVIGGEYPIYLEHIYVLNIKNGPNFGMEWRVASNTTLDKPIINTNSILVEDVIFTFSSGVQRLQLSNSKDLKFDFLRNDDLTPQRCASGNVYDPNTNYIHAIGGEDCNNGNILYNVSQISQNMTSISNDSKKWWSIIPYWAYIAAAFGVILFFVFVVVCACRNKNENEQYQVVGGHVQEHNFNNPRPAFGAEGSHRSQDGIIVDTMN